MKIMKNKILVKNNELTVDISAFDDKDEVLSLQRKNFNLILGKDSFLRGFDANLIGQKSLPLYEFSMVIPSDFKDEKLRGKTLDFKVHNKAKIKVNSETNLDKEKIKSLEKELANQKEKNALLLLDNVKLKSEKEKIIKDFKDEIKTFENRAREKIAEKLNLEKQLLENKFEDFKKYGSQKIFESIMPIIQNLLVAIEWGSKSQNHEVKQYVIGFTSLLDQLLNTLNSFNLVLIEPKIGEIFDPVFHEIKDFSNDLTKAKDSITEVVSLGYKLHERVLKPAGVKVVKN
ncbi:heat shock protein [Mycoplasmopsis pulmonis]|nr:heat shock protein [Mycoplasmopsis pulmonis]